ncbi:hypothetical protein R6242_21970 [Iodobacter sp. CM08]|uniref:hypothetical protein n=1 Tax=Iodobacter sp. CM08 TaxID=3085902 RepID=UPI002982575F|nr:hypothetical protein [Iodobacter sp. CM08]MDW5419244.1 hypothetical protein [Iodobacter sp. CM08]
MAYFEIGMVSFLCAVALPLVYFCDYQFRRLGAWTKRGDKPKDRIGFFLVTAAITGFIIGSFIQPSWNKAAECRATAGQTGQSVMVCMFLQK